MQKARLFTMHNFKNTESWEGNASKPEKLSDNKLASPPTV